MAVVAFLRSVVFLLLATLITAPAGLFVTLAVILPMRVRFQIIAVWRALFMGLCAQVLGLRYQVVGRENIPAVPSVILAKHQSAWETIGLQAIFPPLVFVLKRTLLLIPFLGWAFAAVKMISIDRNAGKNALRQVLKQGKERLKAGYWVIIFPEGTRISPGKKGNYKTGGAMLAVSAKVPAVPVAHNAGEFWAKNAFVKKPGLITVSIGPAIDTTGKTVEQVSREAEQWIETEMRRLSPHRYPAADATAR
ncbi:lysophospholipid acyltransferase family protein [Propionivibrio limicola]|uniref:lysophospholipid acyltransferase family protein n=1 Tax=Propionivibrio limicola TaxID=167645 RepID=UPI0012922565|nr:lysophospholipid acyltransferase family protein [Propionivibrio limicola]